MPSEAITVVLSTRGWVRAAKGHDIDVRTLNYKSGDEFQDMAQGRSNQSVVFVDSFGRAYSLAAHSLPSARGQGEPLTGRFKPASGAEFRSCIMGRDEDRFPAGVVARLWLCMPVQRHADTQQERQGANHPVERCAVIAGVRSRRLRSGPGGYHYQ